MSIFLILLLAGSGALYVYASRHDWLDAGGLRRKIASMIVLLGATELLMRGYLDAPAFQVIGLPLLWISEIRSLASLVAFAAIIVGVLILNDEAARRPR